jgi:hypothetical protein
VPLLEQKQITLLEHLSSPLVYSVFVLVSLKIFVLCSVDCCLSIFFLPLSCLSFDLRLLMTPLVSSIFSHMLDIAISVFKLNSLDGVTCSENRTFNNVILYLCQ